MLKSQNMGCVRFLEYCGLFSYFVAIFVMIHEWCGVKWRGVAWHGVWGMRYGVVWCSMLWYYMLWYAMVCYGCMYVCFSYWNRTWSSLSLHAISKHPESKVHGAIMGLIWGRQDPGGPNVGPINLAIWVQC